MQALQLHVKARRKVKMSAEARALAAKAGKKQENKQLLKVAADCRRMPERHASATKDTKRQIQEGWRSKLQARCTVRECSGEIPDSALANALRTHALAKKPQDHNCTRCTSECLANQNHAKLKQGSRSRKSLLRIESKALRRKCYQLAYHTLGVQATGDEDDCAYAAETPVL